MLKQFTKQERSWIMYDWANSAYSTIVTAAILPVYFIAIATSGGLANHLANSYWGYATSAGALIMALFAPVLGNLANYRGMKKRLFIAFYIIGIVSTAALFFNTGWKFLLIFYALAIVGFGGSSLFYDSFLIDITTKERMDKVSSYGFGMGYIGGSTIPFIAAILLIQFGPKIGISADLASRISFLMAAVWWAVFSIPFLRDVHQVHFEEKTSGIIRKSFLHTFETLKNIRSYRHIFIFLIAYFFYIDGVNTIIHMATVYGSSVGIDSGMMIVALLVIQVLAFPFAILFGICAKKFGGSIMIMAGICVYVCICFVGFMMTVAWQFWLLAVLVATSQGGIQAISRSYFSRMLPIEKANEFFGFYEIFGKFAAILGPLLYGVTTHLTGQTKYGVLSILVLFIVGGLLFLYASKLCKPYHS